MNGIASPNCLQKQQLGFKTLKVPYKPVQQPIQIARSSEQQWSLPMLFQSAIHDHGRLFLYCCIQKKPTLKPEKRTTAEGIKHEKIVVKLRLFDFGRDKQNCVLEEEIMEFLAAHGRQAVSWGCAGVQPQPSCCSTKQGLLYSWLSGAIYGRIPRLVHTSQDHFRKAKHADAFYWDQQLHWYTVHL